MHIRRKCLTKGCAWCLLTTTLAPAAPAVPAELEVHIRKKYVTKDWASQEESWPPTDEFEDEGIR